MEQKQQDYFKTSQFLSLPFHITPFNIQLKGGFQNFTSNQPITTSPVTQPISQVSNPSKYQDFDEGIEYFINFFSPKQTAKSLQRRNENLQLLTFDYSDGEQPDDIYNRRKKKVTDLINQQKQQVQAIRNIRKQSEEKYNAIIQFVKFFCNLKSKLTNKRTDYYSSKTFCALKNSSQLQLINLKKVMQKIYANSIYYPQTTEEGSDKVFLNDNQINNRIMEFLILPRFLISKEKINRLIKDQVLQKNFQFLIGHECLGHYNNEANKKMPQQNQMKYVRQILSKKLGRQKFKKICSINHGNKFLKSYEGAYYNLYSQSLNYLQYLDNCLKKGKKYDSIKKDLQKIAVETQQTVSNSSNTQNQSSNNIYSFKVIKQCLNRIQHQDQDSKFKSEIMDQIEYPVQIEQVTMQKKKIKKMMSTPIQQQDPQNNFNNGFKVRKFNSMQHKVEQNIILIPPPKSQQI